MTLKTLKTLMTLMTLKTLRTLETFMKRAVTLLIVVWSFVGFGFSQGTFTNPILGGDFPIPPFCETGKTIT